MVDRLTALLRADISHKGPFKDKQGNSHPNGTPHFHEIDYSRVSQVNRQGTRRVVPPCLSIGIAEPDFFTCFKKTYRIDDGSSDVVVEPTQRETQLSLASFGGN